MNWSAGQGAGAIVPAERQVNARAEEKELAAGKEKSKALPTVSIVYLVYNRRDELRESLNRMLSSEYDLDRLEVIVVDNASVDGSGAMVEAEFPGIRVIARSENSGVSGFNDGFEAAGGDLVLALDDDCYLPRDGLSQAVAAAQAAQADLVSFGVESSFDSNFRFDRRYRTGLLSFWGCAVLIRREVIEQLDGYDPEIFVWANELEFMLRFFDAGFRHLHLPEVVAVHMKEGGQGDFVASKSYQFNARNFAYIAAKLLQPREAAGALVARLATHLREAIRVNPVAFRAIPKCLSGFMQGLRHRQPVRSCEISRVYRRNFESFVSPWRVSRPPIEFLRPRGDPRRRREELFSNRYYPETSDTLEFQR